MQEQNLREPLSCSLCNYQQHEHIVLALCGQTLFFFPRTCQCLSISKRLIASKFHLSSWCISNNFLLSPKLRISRHSTIITFFTLTSNLCNTDSYNEAVPCPIHVQNLTHVPYVFLRISRQQVTSMFVAIRAAQHQSVHISGTIAV